MQLACFKVIDGIQIPILISAAVATLLIGLGLIPLCS
ncbi:hypothetical protein IC1_04338 [Bacillus cereus VD022]|uniref:Uncharacterized protein n=1 Tax=Bacillus cereus TIAC219 TaxID=718222 RepID=A0ABC9SUL4_BACCE|nr:hypothetical protein IC1_04338 [Bacillus cereus VD022]EOQ59609.1 hypothetical protein IAY_03864 [Bacillus cereus TIAC219]